MYDHFTRQEDVVLFLIFMLGNYRSYFILFLVVLFVLCCVYFVLVVF